MERINAYHLEGMFFQPDVGFHVNVDLTTVRTRFLELVEHNYFSGIVLFDSLSMKVNGTGRMNDAYGKSYLSFVSFRKNNMAFIKRYEGETAEIKYTFEKKHGNIWIGKFVGSKTGIGYVNCRITPCSEELFVNHQA